MSTKKAKSDFEFALEVALPSGETDRLFAHESALQQRIAELEKQYEARGLVVKCQRARIDELEFAIGNPSLLARVDSKQRLAEMVDNEFKLAERIAELEERNERLTRENGSTLLALSKAERELAAEKYEHLHSINQRDGLYVQLEAFKAKVKGCITAAMTLSVPGQERYALHNERCYLVPCADVEGGERKEEPNAEHWAEFNRER